jgi:hypothetical protein
MYIIIKISDQKIDSKTFFQNFCYFFKNNNFDLFSIKPVGPKKINIEKMIGILGYQIILH